MHLTEREREVLQLFCYKDSEIADILKISLSTVKTHCRHICKKLNGTTKIKALVNALRYGYENVFNIKTNYVDAGFWDKKGKYKIKMIEVEDEKSSK